MRFAAAKALMLTIIIGMMSISLVSDAAENASGLLEATEVVVGFDSIFSHKFGLRGISKVAVLALPSADDESPLWTKGDLENQLLEGLRSKLPQLEIVLRDQELAAQRSPGRYKVLLTTITMANETISGDNMGHVAYVRLSVERTSIVPGPTKESPPVYVDATLWAKGYLSRSYSSADKSLFKEKIYGMIAELAADYQKQNSDVSPKSLGADKIIGYSELAALWSEFKSFAFLTTILAYAHLSDKDATIRANAVRIIGLIGREKDIQALEEMAQEEIDETVRKAAVEALEAIGKGE